MTQSILIFGAGRIGKTLAYLMQNVIFKPEDAPIITLVDSSQPALDAASSDGFQTHLVKKVKDDQLSDHYGKLIQNYNPRLVINALPHHLNKILHVAVVNNEVSYLDLTEDVEDTDSLIKYANAVHGMGNWSMTMMPQQGLAPGLVNIIGCWMVKQQDERIKIKADAGQIVNWPKELRLRVGALPQVARGKLGYATTWSIDGLINEYFRDAVELVDGKIVKFIGLSGYERLSFRGVELEAFRTSGGIGVLPELLQRRVPNVNYKTLRWPGHHEVLTLLTEELKVDERLMKEIFQNAAPASAADCVYLLASLDVNAYPDNSRVETYDFGRRYTGLNVSGRRFDAIQIVTALGAIGVIELFLDGKLPTGLITPDMIDYPQFEQTKAGQLLNTATDVYLNATW